MDRENGSQRQRKAGSLLERPTPSAKARGLRVLVIDDNQDHVLLLRRTLEARGHLVSAALGGKEGIWELTRADYDVVALDYQLPDSTGLEVLKLIRQRTTLLP